MQRRVRERFKRDGAVFKVAKTFRTNDLNGISVRLNELGREVVFRSERGELFLREETDFGRKLRESRSVARLSDRVRVGVFTFRLRFLATDERRDAQEKRARSNERRPTR